MGKTKDFSSDFNSLLGGKNEETKEANKAETKKPATARKKTVEQTKKQPEAKPVQKVEKTAVDKPAPIPPKRVQKGSVEKSYSLEDATEVEHVGRATKGRKKFTMMMRPDIRDMLNRIAINKRQSISDVIENVLCEYFDIE